METVSLSSLVAAIKMSVEGFVFGFGLKSNFCVFLGWTVACWKLLPVLGGSPTGVLVDSRADSTHKGVDYHLKDFAQTQQQQKKT